MTRRWPQLSWRWEPRERPGPEILTPEAMVAWDRDFGGEFVDVYFVSAEDLYDRGRTDHDFVAWQCDAELPFYERFFLHYPTLGRWVRGTDHPLSDEDEARLDTTPQKMAERMLR